jgi:hypothetical protein
MEVGRDPITYKLRLTSYVRSNSKLQSSLPAFCVTEHILPRSIPLPLSFYSRRCCFYNAVSKTECVWTAYLFDSSLVNLEFWWKANVRGHTVLDFGKREWRISVEFPTQLPHYHFCYCRKRGTLTREKASRGVLCMRRILMPVMWKSAGCSSGALLILSLR